MLGNDIVDFSIDEHKYNQPRFIQRVLTSKEQDFLFQSTAPNHFLWSLWAAKEAGFKAAQRNNPTLIFSPSAYEVSIDTLKELTSNAHATHLTGEIKFQQESYSLKYHWPINTVVHCVVCRNIKYWPYIDSQISHTPNLTTYQKQYHAVRVLAQKILTKHNINADIIRPDLNRSDYVKPGAPILINPNNQVLLPHIITLSHDHNYLAVALYCRLDGLK